MKPTFQIGMTLLAASLASPGVFAQATTAPHARAAATISMGGSYLGIGVQDIDADRAKALKLRDVRGAEITRIVDESPAAKAGLKDGDVILDYNGQQVEGKEQLARMISETPVGRQVKIGVWRNGAPQNVTATVEEQKGLTFLGDSGEFFKRIEPLTQMQIPKMQAFAMSPMIGIYGESLAQQEQLAEFFGVKEGVLVRSVTPNSAAEKAGLKAGDVIVKVDDTHVNTTGDITSALRAARSRKSVTLTVMRNKKEMPLTVTIEAALPAVRARVGYMVTPHDNQYFVQPLPMSDYPVRNFRGHERVI
jgi:serine protease Do